MDRAYGAESNCLLVMRFESRGRRPCGGRKCYIAPTTIKGAAQNSKLPGPDPGNNPHQTEMKAPAAITVSAYLEWCMYRQNYTTGRAKQPGGHRGGPTLLTWRPGAPQLQRGAERCRNAMNPNPKLELGSRWAKHQKRPMAIRMWCAVHRLVWKPSPVGFQ